MQVLQEQKPAPKSTATGVFPVGASGDRLIERFHEPGEAAESHAASDKSVCIAEQRLFLQAAAHVIHFSVNGCRKQANPTYRNFFVRPCGRRDRIDTQHDMYMVAHHRVGVHANGKDLRQLQQALLYPLAPMLIGRSIVRIDTAQPCPAHTPRDAVIEAGSVGIDKKAAGGSHAASVTLGRCVVCRKFPTRDVGYCRNSGCPASTRKPDGICTPSTQ